MKLFGILLLMAGCASASSEIDLESDTDGSLDPGQNLMIVLHDQLESGYELVSATYHLDGHQVFSRRNENGWSEAPQDVRIYRGRVDPGRHVLTLMLEYQPNDLGIFTYARGYRLKIESRTGFHANPDETTAVHAVISDQGRLTTQVDQRPEVRYYVTRPAHRPRQTGAVVAAGPD